MQRLHDDEVPISRALAEDLLAEQLPGFSGLPLRILRSQGTDNVVFRLGDEYSVRLPRKEAAVPSLLVEVEWLPRLAPHLPLPVAVPVAQGEPTADYPFPWAVCRWVPGTTPEEPDGPDRFDGGDTACRLGRFVRALHAVDTAGAPVAGARTQRGGSLAAVDDLARGALEELSALLAVGRLERDLFDVGAARDLWAAAVDAPAWQQDGVWLHRDLHAGNLLAIDHRLSGVLDFGGLVVGDPAGDVMAAWHVIPPAHRDDFFELLEVDAATRLRARGWVLFQGLLALPYYLDTHPGMVRMARRAIRISLDTAIPTGG